MFELVSEENIYIAAEIHSLSWIESHRSFCSEEFVQSHTIERQKQYIEKEMKKGKDFYILIENGAKGIVSVKDNIIENLYVLPSEQNKGYGTKLLKNIEKMCKGVPTLWILSNNEVARKFYQKNNYIFTGNKKVLNDNLSELEMCLGIAQIIHQDDGLQISIGDTNIGLIKTYMNPYHTEHCYLELQMKQYDVKIAKELFEQIYQRLGKPMQVMISSEDKVRVDFIRAAGFVCKRKCYEINASASDYVGQIIQGELECAVKGDDIYEKCCEAMLERYILTHKNISPWTGTKEDFVQSLPEMVYYQMQDGQIVNLAFVEENEIAYVSGSEKESFTAFAQALISKLLEQKGRITFEADDCDTYAMDLKALFVNQSQESFDAYIY